MGKLLIKINIVQTQFWKKPIYKVLSRFRKQRVLFRLFSRIFFCGKRKPIKHLKIIYLAHHSHPCKRSYTCAIYYQFHKWAVNFDMREVDSRYSLRIKLRCKILNSSLLLEWCCFRCGGLEDEVCKFVYFEIIIFTCISVLTEAVTWRCSVKKVFLQISQNSQGTKITPWLTSHTRKIVSHY